MSKYICRNKYNMTLFAFDSEPTYDALLDMWDGEGYRILPFEEAAPYLKKVTFKNSPYKIQVEADS